MECPKSFLNSLQIVRPSEPGIMISSTARSQGSVLKQESSSSPVEKVFTLYPAFVRNSLRTSSISGSSSAAYISLSMGSLHTRKSCPDMGRLSIRFFLLRFNIKYIFLFYFSLAYSTDFGSAISVDHYFRSVIAFDLVDDLINKCIYIYFFKFLH